MRRVSLIALFVTGFLGFAATAATAAPIVLDFEGIPDQTAIGDFYNGVGGPNYGIVFAGDTLALVDEDAGGGGSFANEPSPDTIMFFLEDPGFVNVAAGFTTSLFFYYTAAEAGIVNIYEGLNGTGNLLASIPLIENADVPCTGDPTGDFCHFDLIGTTFLGTARSVDFGGTANVTGYDNVEFGSVNSGTTPVPEPATMLLLGTGAVAVFRNIRVQRRRRAVR
jgi:hypothetical protein